MPYTTVTDVRGILTRDLLASEGTAASVPQEVIQQAITDASEEIDATLRSRYVVPFVDPAPVLVSRIARDFAAFYSDLVWRQEKDYDSEREPLLLRRARSQSLLEKLADGSLLLSATEAPSTDVTGEGHVINPYQGVLFEARDLLRGVASGTEYAERPRAVIWGPDAW